MGLIQRVLDDAGLTTISITQVPEITAIVKPSRSVFVAHPFGLTFGDTGDAATQRAVVDFLLAAAGTMATQGMIVGPFSWREDDLRFRQLRKLRS